ncbi:MAG: MFS transporter [Lachnospiraceae bacterium]|nr:MFS transporter [Lachnospiraceae bacterium]
MQHTSLKQRWQHSSLRTVYNFSDPYAKGRCRILGSNLLDNVCTQLTTDIFYTSFLLYYDMDKSKIGFLTFIPYITCLLNLFSPMILERFQRRKTLLITAKLTHCFVNYIGIAILPTLLHGNRERMMGLAILIVSASAISQLFSSGWTAWHANYLQEEVRIDYFRSSNCISSAFSFTIALFISYLGDRFIGTPNEIILLTSIRYIAFGLMLIDTFIWIAQKEFPYEKTVRIKFSNIFTLPVKNKLFLMTMVLLALHHFSNGLPTATLNAYLLKDVGVSYTLISAINASYFLFFFPFTKMCTWFTNKLNLYRAYGVSMIVMGISNFAYSYVTANTIWLYVVIRLVHHVLGVMLSGVVSAILYDHLPQADRTNYLSFYTIAQNFSIFLAMMLSTALAAIMKDNTIRAFGIAQTSTQLSLVASAVMMFFLGTLSITWAKKLIPSKS